MTRVAVSGLILLTTSFVSCRPYTTYCSLPCPVTEPCPSPFYPQPVGPPSPYLMPGPFYPPPTHVCYSEEKKKEDDDNYRKPAHKRPAPPKERAPANPEPDTRLKRPGLLTSLFSLPGVIADAVLSGEFTI